MPVTMASVVLPQARYKVSLTLKGRSHFYRVEDLSGNVKGVFPGVTGKLSIINKPQLVPWAANQGIARTVAALIVTLKGAKGEETEAVADKVANLMKAAKKASGGKGAPWASYMADLLAAEFKLGRKTAKLDHALLASIMEEATNAPEKVKKDAADLGTMAHDAIDRIVKGEDLKDEDIPAAVRVPVRNFRDWLASSGIHMVLGDTAVASVKDEFGGKLDALGWDDNGYVILDWKTSSGIYDEYALQVSAYAAAFEETYGVPVRRAIIVRFDKKVPEWSAAKDVREVRNLTVSYGAFLHASELNKAMKDTDHFLGNDDV